MLMVDNQPAITLTKNPILHDWSKHIDIKYHFLCDCINGGQIVLEFFAANNSQTSSPSHLGAFRSQN
jgi:hypothetical protein